MIICVLCKRRRICKYTYIVNVFATRHVAIWEKKIYTFLKKYIPQLIYEYEYFYPFKASIVSQIIEEKNDIYVLRFLTFT